MKVILCVDDEKIILTSLKKELREFFKSSYYIEIAENGEEALELIEEFLQDGHEIPLVITDYIMPNMRGDELLKRVSDLSPETLGIMLSGQADLIGVRNSIRYGRLQSFIPKPWESVDLIGDIQKTLNIYEQVEKIKQQNQELIDINANLEQKVEQKLQEIKQKNEILRESDFTLRKTVLELADANEKLEQVNQEKDNLMGIVAHDLRSPLNNIKGLLNLVKLTGNLSAEQAEYLQMIDGVIHKGNQLIDDLLTINSYEHQNTKLIFKEIHLSHFLEEILTPFENTAKEKAINLQKEIDTAIYIRTDDLVLSRIITNLVSNAIKFSPAQKNVAIRARLQEGFLKVQVQDEGQGFTAEDQAKAFQKFQKLTARPTAGESSTGLGLSIVKILTEKLGGTIHLESEWKVGSTFTLVFPA